MEKKTPEKIKYQNMIFTHNGFGNDNYWCEEKKKNFFEECFILEDLNNEVEIIEEKIGKIPVITHKDGYKRIDCDALQSKIDELIDVVNELKTEK